jgi:CRP/FNR family transcriptional regulator, cyclic AMP receptor protein
MSAQAQTGPIATRVALHPFLDGMNRALLSSVVLESGGGSSDPVVLETIEPGDLLGWSWMFPPYLGQFTARAVEPTTAIFFYGTILREYCEKNHSLGYELFKRMSAVMVKRLQAARQRMLSLREADHFR